jgi:hypothetical protein
MPTTPADLVPIDVAQLLQRRWKLNGTLPLVSGSLDYEGELELTVDVSGLGDLVKKAMLQRGRTAKGGPITVRYRGRADTKRHPREEVKP